MMNTQLLSCKSLAVAALLAAANGTSAQELVLSAGQSYTNSFETLTLDSNQPLLLDSLSAGVDFVSPDWLSEGDIVTIRLYENSTSEAPFYTEQFVGPSLELSPGISAVSAGSQAQADNWRDFQGAMTFTVDSGEVNVAQVRVQVIEGGNIYFGATVIPEPGTLALGAMAAVVFAGAARYQRRRKA